jgi:hypothetical protein
MCIPIRTLSETLSAWNVHADRLIALGLTPKRTRQ